MDEKKREKKKRERTLDIQGESKRVNGSAKDSVLFKIVKIDWI